MVDCVRPRRHLASACGSQTPLYPWSQCRGGCACLATAAFPSVCVQSGELLDCLYLTIDFYGCQRFFSNFLEKFFCCICNRLTVGRPDRNGGGVAYLAHPQKARLRGGTFTPPPEAVLPVARCSSFHTHLNFFITTNTQSPINLVEKFTSTAHFTIY